VRRGLGGVAAAPAAMLRLCRLAFACCFGVVGSDSRNDSNRFELQCSAVSWSHSEVLKHEGKRMNLVFQKNGVVSYVVDIARRLIDLMYAKCSRDGMCRKIAWSVMLCTLPVDELLVCM